MRHTLLILNIIAITLCILLKVFYPKFRGYMGEFWVKLELKKLPNKEYYVLNDVMIEDDCGTHQIDHLVISKYGIFVIEMKNYYGLITGDEYKDKWVQHLGRNKYFFTNPIHQNYGHVKCLEKLLKLENEFFIPIICFSNSAKLRIKSKSQVVNLDYLTDAIKKFYKPLLNNNIEEIITVINKNNILDKEKRKQHVKGIKNKVKLDNAKADNMICPKCGSGLILKNGKYGTFVGCTNYPKCRYIKK